MYSSRPSLLAAKMSLIAGAVAWCAWTAFIHIKEAEALELSNLLFGLLHSAWSPHPSDRGCDIFYLPAETWDRARGEISVDPEFLQPPQKIYNPS